MSPKTGLMLSRSSMAFCLTAFILHGFALATSDPNQTSLFSMLGWAMNFIGAALITASFFGAMRSAKQREEQIIAFEKSVKARRES